MEMGVGTGMRVENNIKDSTAGAACWREIMTVKCNKQLEEDIETRA